jgi:hypothetical protein
MICSTKPKYIYINDNARHCVVVRQGPDDLRTVPYNVEILDEEKVKFLEELAPFPKIEPHTFTRTISNNKRGWAKFLKVKVEIRFDDQCGNGHHDFAATADLYECSTRTSLGKGAGGGCCHDEIIKAFPELTPMIRWHLGGTQGPWGYIANTIYHARDCDTPGMRPGDVKGYDTRLKFKDFPFTFSEQKKGFWAYLDKTPDWDDVKVEPIIFDGKDTYNYTPNYSLTGFIKDDEDKKWYKAPFKSEREASEFLEAIRTRGYEFVKTPSAWAKAEEVNLEYTRNASMWPDATLEQLRDENALIARLPALLDEFYKDMETCFNPSFLSGS